MMMGEFRPNDCNSGIYDELMILIMGNYEHASILFIIMSFYILPSFPSVMLVGGLCDQPNHT